MDPVPGTARGLRYHLGRLARSATSAIGRPLGVQRHAEEARWRAATAAGLERLERGQSELLQKTRELEANVRALQALNGEPGATFLHALNKIGVLNYENSVVSGEWRFLERYFRTSPRAVVLDVGANEGQFAALARQCGPDAAIHSFEPHPRAFSVLRERSVALNVTPHQLALSDTEGAAEFFDYADNQGSQHASLYREVIEQVHGRPATAISVQCTTLDQAAARLGLDRIGLLKIDTEGHELAVLRGARGLIDRGAIDVIQFEFNEMNVISRTFMKDYIDFLKTFRLYRLLDDGVIELAPYNPRTMEIFAFQNIACIRQDLDQDWLTAA